MRLPWGESTGLYSVQCREARLKLVLGLTTPPGEMELDLGHCVQNSSGLFYLQPLDSGLVDLHCYIGPF